jgi:GMP synthase (glutamine-hydrolysing)
LKRRTILILKTGETLAPVKVLFGDFEDWIADGLGCSVADLDVANVYRGGGLADSLPEASEISGVVITGSPAMVTERPDWSESSARWLADLVREDAVPVLGLCYGHQLLAHALGGEVGPNPNGREMGTVDVTFSDDALSSTPTPTPTPTDASTCESNLEDPFAPLFERGVFPGHMSHVESVLRPPPGASVLARTALDPHSVLAFGPRQWGVQFHPEFDRPILRRYVEARREILAGEGLDPDAMIESAVETPELTEVLRRFARLAATRA